MNSIEKFLSELYEIDPGLRNHEEDLKPLIQKLLSADPAQKPDSTFVESLRRQLQNRASSLSLARRRPKGSPLGPESEGGSFLSSMQKFLYGIAGAAVAVVIAVPAVYYGTQGLPSSSQNTSEPLFSYRVSDTTDNAFGDLSAINAASGEGYARGQGGGGNGNIPPVPAAVPQATSLSVQESAQDAATNDAKIGVSESMIIDPGFYPQMQYTFSGSLPALPEGTVSVLKRIKDIGRPAMSAILDNFNLGSMNLGSFGNAKVDSITFSQDTDFGYMVSIMLREGMVSISQNWEKWPHPEMNCRDEACYQRFQVKIDEIPEDQVLLDIAAKFVRDHGIATEGYGAPEVDTNWRRDYERMTDKRYAYIPQSQQVLYPLIVDERPVYDQGGTKMGIRVGVDIRQKRVSDVWGMQNQNFLRSDYAAATAEDVTKFLGEFERTPAEYLPTDIKVTTVNVPLGEPSLGYTVYYDYTKPMGEELIVPALIFPVQTTPENQQYLWRQNITVPLAKELHQQMNGFGGGAMPLMEKSVQ